MPATRLLLNNILNYNFGYRGYSPALPSDYYFGLSTALITESSNLSAAVTAMSYTLKVVTLTCINIFTAGDIVTVVGVDAGFTVTNIDGTWTVSTATPTQVVFTVTNQPVGTTPQTITVGTVSGAIVSEPPEHVDGNDSLYARVAYSNDASPQQWTVSTIGTLSNTVAVTFPESGANAPWGTMFSVFIADASAIGTGNILWYYTLNPSIIVQEQDIVSFAIGDIVSALT